jgi:hypothetical protein
MSGSGLFSKQRPDVAHLSDGELADLREDVKNTFAPMAAITVEEFTNPPAADTDAFKTSIATSTSAQSYSGAALNGVVGGAALSPPRNVTVTASDSSASYAGSVTFTGVDINGKAISEAVAISNNATAVGAKAFAKVTKIDVPAQVDTSGALQFGFGVKMGLGKKIVSRAGLVGAVREIAVGAVVTNGTFVAAATGLPNGTYAPNTAQDGVRDYAVYYEYDPTLDPNT